MNKLFVIRVRKHHPYSGTRYDTIPKSATKRGTCGSVRGRVSAQPGRMYPRSPSLSVPMKRRVDPSASLLHHTPPRHPGRCNSRYASTSHCCHSCADPSSHPPPRNASTPPLLVSPTACCRRMRPQNHGSSAARMGASQNKNVAHHPLLSCSALSSSTVVHALRGEESADGTAFEHREELTPRM